MNHLKHSETTIIKLDDVIYGKYFKIDFFSNNPSIIRLIEFLQNRIGADRRFRSIQEKIKTNENEYIKIRQN